jgi:iron complex transport system substrate-binding protein
MLEWDELLDWRPEVLVVACCGYSAERARAELAFLHARPGVSDLPWVRSGRVYLADGIALFSRPGPSLVASLELLAAMVEGSITPTLPDESCRPPWHPPGR